MLVLTANGCRLPLPTAAADCRCRLLLPTAAAELSHRRMLVWKNFTLLLFDRIYKMNRIVRKDQNERSCWF
jgi:hypothetical protein